MMYQVCTKYVPSKCTKMSKTRKHQATYDYLSNNKDVRGRLMIGIRKFFNRCNWPKWDSSRKRWYKHKIDKNEPTN